MTREEKEQTGKYVLQMARLLEDGCYQQKMLLKAVHIIDEALDQESKTGRWIPVSERLPEKDGRFLTYIENPYDIQLSYIMVCDYINQTWCPDDETARNNVVEWMPLPEKPYKGESEE